MIQRNYGKMKSTMYNNKCTKGCTMSTWNARVALEKLDSQSIKSLTKFHDFSRLIFSNSMFFPGFLDFFSNSMIFPGPEKVFFIFQVSMIFPEAGNPAYYNCRNIEEGRVFISGSYLGRASYLLVLGLCIWLIKGTILTCSKDARQHYAHKMDIEMCP